MTVAFGILVENSSKLPASDLAEELDSASKGEDWKWVLWELNKAYFAIILGTLAMKGRVSQIETLEVISLGEAVDESEDSRARWLFPSRSSVGSVHELAHRKIAQFIAISYGENVKMDEDEVARPVKPVEKVLAPISTRRKISAGTAGVGALARANKGNDMMAGSREKEDYESKADSTPKVSTPIPGGNVARKSRRSG